MAEKMNGFNFGTTMKKIFFAIIALAALVGCNTNVMEEVATTPQYLTTSFEVDLDGDTRAFDGDLNWSWESTDEIAAFQFAGEQFVNTLSLKENGKFGTEEFKYATTDPSTFVFVYPFAAYDAESQDVGYVQTGVWTPTLVGIVNDATVNSIGSVEMTHMSAAFEIRVWDEGRQARKNIKAATITSESDFCDGTTATVSDINSDTVVFNIAEGDFAFNLTLTAADGATYTVAVPAKNFENGKRTILNVEWKKTASYSVYTSYTDKNNSLDGHTIYVENVAVQNSDAKSVELYINGTKHSDLAVGGQLVSISGLAVGEYNTYIKLTDGEYSYTSKPVKVYVTGIPCSYKFYQSSDAAVDAAGWTRNGKASTKEDLMTLHEGGLAGDNSGWIASPAYYAPNGELSSKVTLEAKYYVAALRPSGNKAELYVGATSSPTSSSSTSSSLTLNGSNNTKSGQAWSTVSTGVNIPKGTQYVSINHNKATYYLGSRIYLCSYKIEYSK